MKSNENYPFNPEVGQPAELTDGTWADFQKGNPNQKPLDKARQNEALAREAVAAAKEKEQPDPKEFIHSFGRGIIRMRVIKQQETLEHDSRSWDTFEPTR